ncbi:IS3 family transposase [Xanthomonas oryzae]|uniref:IS3 family transposase n=1 Tax=Xanthomonas oryzae TaxID=347 RepID=UPI003CFC0975
MQTAFQASGGNYGSRRLSASLKAQGLPAGRHRVRRLMKRHGLKARWKRKFTHTTDSRHDLPVAANVLDRRFKPSAADQAWVADITYIRTERGWLYLAAVLDPVLAQDRWLGDGTEHACRAGVLRLADGHRPAPAQAGTDHAYRPR